MPYVRESIEGRLLENDTRALAQVVRWISVVLTAPRFWRLRAEWADLQQETLMRIIESLRQERFDPSREFRTYVQGAARYTALQALSRRHHETGGLADAHLPSAPADQERSAIRRQMVRRIFEQISDPCRRLIRLYFLEERNYDDIAARLSLPTGTIKSRLFRCLRAAHRALHRRDLESVRLVLSR